jgi:hypothetical protein
VPVYCDNLIVCNVRQVLTVANIKTWRRFQETVVLICKTWQWTVFVSSKMPALVCWTNPDGALSVLNFSLTLEIQPSPRATSQLVPRPATLVETFSHKRNMTTTKVVPEICFDQETNIFLLARSLQKCGIQQNKWQFKEGAHPLEL